MCNKRDDLRGYDRERSSTDLLAFAGKAARVRAHVCVAEVRTSRDVRPIRRSGKSDVTINYTANNRRILSALTSVKTRRVFIVRATLGDYKNVKRVENGAKERRNVQRITV